MFSQEADDHSEKVEIRSRKYSCVSACLVSTPHTCTNTDIPDVVFYKDRERERERFELRSAVFIEALVEWLCPTSTQPLYYDKDCQSWVS